MSSKQHLNIISNIFIPIIQKYNSEESINLLFALLNKSIVGEEPYEFIDNLSFCLYDDCFLKQNL
jgi:hypothetical protein